MLEKSRTKAITSIMTIPQIKLIPQMKSQNPGAFPLFHVVFIVPTNVAAEAPDTAAEVAPFPPKLIRPLIPPASFVFALPLPSPVPSPGTAN